MKQQTKPGIEERKLKAYNLGAKAADEGAIFTFYEDQQAQHLAAGLHDQTPVIQAWTEGHRQAIRCANINRILQNQRR